MRWITVIAFLCTQLVSLAGDRQEMRIGIFRDVTLYKVNVSYLDGNMSVWGDSTMVGEFADGPAFTVANKGGRCRVYAGSKDLGLYDTVRFKRKEYDKGFKIRPVSPSYRERPYQGDLMFTVDEKGKLLVVNEVPLEFYLAGVIESEVGSHRTLEYYKVQAIISRTYALRNINKHLDEGFMLTDLVNCQVYKHKGRRNPEIYKAVRATSGLVIVDQNLSLITASFYSNSGGQTANSEDVWNRPLPYLRSVDDPYSKTMPNCWWKRTIGKSEWLRYLKNRFQYPIEDPTAREKALSFKQWSRKAFFVSPSYGVPLRDIRRDWKLKSTFFNVSLEGANVVLNGRGFGHGVGLSQEGAMAMVKQGFKYDEVIHFYFTDVELLPFDLLEFYVKDISEY